MKKLIAGIIVVVAVVAGGAYFALRNGETSEAASEPAQVVSPIREVAVVADGVLVPVRSIELAFPVDGTIAEVLVAEGDHVVAGQALVRMEASAQARAVAQASSAVVRAQERVAQIQAGSHEADIARAAAAVGAANLALQDADQGLIDRDANIRNARVALEIARHDLSLARLDWDTRLSDALDAVEDAQEDYQDVYQRFLGLELTQEQLRQEPELLLDQAGIDPGQLFSFEQRFVENSRGFMMAEALRGEGPPPNDPATPWSEVVVHGWNYFYPGTVLATCEKIRDAVVSAQGVCVLGEMETAWEPMKLAWETLDSAEVEGAKAIERADNAVLQAKEGLVEQHNGRETLALTTAEAELAAAQRALTELQDGPDPLKTALAELSAAEATLTAAEDALRDTELRAPFAGTIVSLDLSDAQRQTSLGRRTVGPGDQITDGTRVVRVADLSAWRIETEDLDERSVVQINEGDRVTIGFDAIPELEMAGVITRIGAYGLKKQGDITYTVVVTPQGNDERLRWSMTAVVRFGQGS